MPTSPFPIAYCPMKWHAFCLRLSRAKTLTSFVDASSQVAATIDNASALYRLLCLVGPEHPEFKRTYLRLTQKDYVVDLASGEKFSMPRTLLKRNPNLHSVIFQHDIDFARNPLLSTSVQWQAEIRRLRTDVWGEAAELDVDLSMVLMHVTRGSLGSIFADPRQTVQCSDGSIRT